MEEGGKDTDETLFRMLREISPFYFFRKMQQVDLAALNRFVRILGDSQDHRGTGDLTVLNYGYGAADVALLAAAQGCRATICDVERDNLEYASTRFANRGLAVETIGATPKTPISRQVRCDRRQRSTGTRERTILVPRGNEGVSPRHWRLDAW